MANPDFTAILSRKAGDIERPKPLPIGDYLFKIKGLPVFDKSSKKGTPFAEFTCIPVQATDSVDTDDLEQALTKKDGSKKLLQDMTQKLTFYLTEDALYRLKEFCCNDLKIDTPDTEKELDELVNATPNCEFIGTIKHTPSNDGKGTYANIGSTAPAE